MKRGGASRQTRFEMYERPVGWQDAWAMRQMREGHAVAWTRNKEVLRYTIADRPSARTLELGRRVASENDAYDTIQGRLVEAHYIHFADYLEQETA